MRKKSRSFNELRNEPRIVSEMVIDHGFSIRDFLAKGGDGNMTHYRDDQYVTVPIGDLRSLALDFEKWKPSLAMELERMRKFFEYENVKLLMEESAAFRRNYETTGRLEMTMKSIGQLLLEIRFPSLARF